MRVTVNTIDKNFNCIAVSKNNILFIFQAPTTGISLNDVLELNPNILETPQTVLNVSTGARFEIKIQKNDVHDLNLPAAHGASRFPSVERLSEE